MEIQTVTFTQQEVLKSGNVRLSDGNGRDFYVLAGSGVNVPLDRPVAVKFKTETRGTKELQIITDSSGVPSLPKTTVTDTVAPGGESPVKPSARKEAVKSNYGGDFQKPWLPEEARRVAILNIITSCLTSPGYAQECVGRNSEEIDATFRRAVQKAIKLYEESIQPIE